MQNKFRFTLTLATALAVLAFSAIWAAPAFADDSRPPVVENPLDQVPEGTEVVVINESGQVIPLATEEAAQALTAPDPIWCPTGVAPKPGVGGCSASQPNLSTLVSTFIPTKAGTIWIENVADSGTEVVIDGLGTWAPAKNFSLTLQGGWVGGVTGSKTILGVSTFDTAINIVNWNGAVTITDITMDGVPTNAYDSLSGALFVHTTKNILLSNFTAVNTVDADTDGAYLDNTASTTQATVTVKNSSFNNNGYGALTILSDGMVTLTNVNANENIARGVYISNTADSIASVVSVSNSSFNNNNGKGLQINSNGAVKLNQVTANDNGGSGVHVDNHSVASAQPVTVTGSLTALYNGSHGLEIYSKGAITLTNVSANWNTGLGTYLLNNYDNTKPQNITLNGYNFFLHNGDNGLEGYSYGIITINNVTASNNSGNGVSLDNCVWNVSSCGILAAKAVIFKGTNTFNQNSMSGLSIDSEGAITLANVTANSNTSHGVFLYNAYGTKSAVTLTGYGLFDSNSGDGLYITSNGAITTNNLTANKNLGNGANLYTIGILAPQTVTLNGTNNFNYNGNAGSESGLRVFSDGTIKLNNVNASYNYNSGAILDNFTNWDLPVVNFATFGSVTITGFGNFTGNIFNSGLYVHTHGAATLNYITTNYNTNDGIGVSADGKVSVVCSSANNNGWGFYMYGAPTPLLTLKGLITAGNGVNESLSYVTLVRTRCP